MEIAIVAGEVSGDIQAARLVKAIKERQPATRVWGIGGTELQAQGVELIADITQWALIGFWEVLKNYRKIRDIFYRMVAAIAARKPQAVILVDYPGFNLRLAKKVKDLGIPIIYYISPQVWAWGRGRIKQIADLVDKMIVIFPFEAELYQKAGVAVDFVGHPIIDVLNGRISNQDKFRKELGVRTDQPLVAILPGSREQEVKRHLPVFLQAAMLTMEQIPTTKFVVGAASEEIGQLIKEFDPDFHVVVGQTYDLIEVSDLALTSSGTATLETACLGTPMVVIYKLNWLTYLFLKPMIAIPDIAMVNVVAGRRIVPELVQHHAQAKAVAQEAVDILANPARQNRIKDELRKVREKMGAPGAVNRAAEIVCSVIKYI